MCPARVLYSSITRPSAGCGFRVGVPGMRSRNASRNAEFWVSRAFPFRLPRSVENRPALPSQIPPRRSGLRRFRGSWVSTRWTYPPHACDGSRRSGRGRRRRQQQRLRKQRQLGAYDRGRFQCHRGDARWPSTACTTCPFMREHYPNAVGEAVPSMGTVLTEAQNDEVEEVEVMESLDIDI